MNILCVNGRFGDQLQALGHAVTNVVSCGSCVFTPAAVGECPLSALKMLALEPGCTWQDRLRFALKNFRCFRFQEGVEEIAQTVRLAVLAGEGSFLKQALQASANPPILHLIQMEMAR